MVARFWRSHETSSQGCLRKLNPALFIGLQAWEGEGYVSGGAFDEKLCW